MKMRALIHWETLNLFHYVKSVRIWSYSGPYFPTFGPNTERYGVSLRIQSECGKMRTKITTNTDMFHAVYQTLRESVYYESDYFLELILPSM